MQLIDSNKVGKTKWRAFLTALLVLTLIPTACLGKSAEPNAEQIKADLIGEVMIAGGTLWRFAALSEFQELTVKGQRKQGQIIEYDVSMRLQDLESKRQYIADAVIVYKKANGRWEIISITPRLWREIS